MPDDLSARLSGFGLPDGENPPPADDPASMEPAVPGDAAEGIVPLGHDRGTFYYLSRAARQVFALPAERHSRNALMAMASVAHYWQRSRFVNSKGAVQWDDAVDWLMRACRDVGIYDPDRIRGRGAWLDDGRAVLHVGDALIVDGERRDLSLPESRHVYEAAQRLGNTEAEPLATTEAHKLVEICASLRWEVPVNGALLAGFIAVAPVCGGLAWRPSIWITGGAGAGKSYLSEKILAPALGGIALQVQSKTSEAGIRQLLGSDARPVLFDEAEGEDQNAAARMQGVIDLVRQSASEGGAEIIKGSTSGQAKRYRIRSSFAFSSINHGVRARADAGRISILALREPNEAQREAEAAAFQRLNALVVATITPDFSAGLLARSARLLPVIRQNAETFARAVALHIGNRRDGDQIGTLLAGAYSLHSERLISDEQARDYVARQEWSHVASQDTERDEERLLSHITQHRVRYSAGNGASGDATIGRLIEAAAGRDRQIIQETAEMELMQTGIRFGHADGQPGIYVSNTHPTIARILHGTPWSAGWERALRRLAGATRTDSSIRFAAGHKARATFVPWSVLGDE